MSYSNGNDRAIPECVTGAGLARRLRTMNAVQRACAAADVDDGTTVLVALTTKTVADLFQVSVPYVAAAAKLSPAERDLVRRGVRPLIPTRAPRAATAPFDWATVNDDVLVEAVRMIGVERAPHAAVAVESDNT